MTDVGEPGSQIVQDVTAKDGFAYGVIGADLHVYANGLPLYLLANWQAQQPGNPNWLRELPSRMLSARRAVVPFTGRADELAELRRWRDSGPPLAVRWLHSPGGQGKTRLAGRLAAEAASDGWKVVTAFQGSDADMPKPDSQDMRLADASGLLMIVDYADRWRLTNLTWLLDNALLHQAGPAVRLLMIARTADAWPAVRRILDTHESDSSSQLLDDLGQETGERSSMFDAALSSFAAIYGLSDAGTVGPPGSLDDPEFGLTLAVHMAALVAVDARATGGRLPSDAAGLSMYLLDREQLHWARLYADGTQAAETTYRTPPQVMNQTVYAAALTGSVTRAVGTTVLENLRLPDPEQILRDHAVCYPSPGPGQATVLEPLYPDRLAEDFLALTMPGHSADYPAQAWAFPTATALLARHGDGHAPAAWTPRTITFLASAAQRWPHLGQRYLNPLLRRDPQLAIDGGSAALGAIADLPGTTKSVLEAIEKRLPDGPHADLDVGVALIYNRLAEHRLTKANPAARSRFLGTLATALSRAGMYEQALAAIQQDVDLKRQLARDNPLIHGYNLASTLDNLGTVLSQLGREDERLAASQEAEETRRWHSARIDTFKVDPVVRIWRRLTSTERATKGTGGAPPPDPDDSRTGWSRLAGKVKGVGWAAADEAGEYRSLLSGPDSGTRIRRFLDRGGDSGREVSLATSLSNQAGYLWENGRQQKALTTVQEAVGLLRRLPPADSPEQHAVLALALHNLGMILSGLGREDEGLTAEGEAVAIRWRLAQANPAVYEPDLALSLTNYSTALPYAGRQEEALAVIQEAVEIRRRLTRANPAVHKPGLATSLTSLSMRLEEAGRHEEALAVSRDAVEIWRQLASASTIHRPGLAHSLTVLGLRLDEAGRQAEALAVTREAVEVWRPLAQASPAAHQSILAGCLATMATLLDDLDQPEEALAAATEAVDIQRRLARALPTENAPRLAAWLAFMATLLTRLDQAEEALAATQEAIEIWQKVARSDPAHEPDLAASLSTLGAQLFQLGQPDKALTALGEAAKLSPESGEAIATRGQVYQAMGRHEDAVADLTRAIELDPELAWAIAERGETYRLVGRHEDALTDLTRAIQLDPDYDWAIASRGDTYRKMGRYDQALADLTRAIQLDPDYAWAIKRRGQTSQAMGSYDDALTDLTRAIELDPKNAWAIATRGKVYQAMGRHEDAVADLTRGIELDPELAWAIAERGETYWLMGRHEDAVTDLTRATRLNPNDAVTLNSQGIALFALGRYQDAIAAWDQMLALDQDDSDAHANKGIALATIRDFGRALTELDTVDRLAPMGGGEGRTWAGAILWHQRDTAGARDRFKRVMGRVTGCTPFRTAEMEAIALCGLGHPRDAEQHLLDAVHLRVTSDTVEPRTIYDLLSDPPLPGIQRLCVIADNSE